ncbi:MAG TPA: ATP-binding cassette domain-containing protein, partial [Propionibacteriaceae bacterium]|nr:ATP-binding cassette domain-containing protein [Propionibacteriaceae bacterium]
MPTPPRAESADPWAGSRFRICRIPTAALSGHSRVCRSRCDRGVTGVVGVNGAGKTTFIRVVSGGLRPTSGHVRVAGHDLY